jgi:Spy/CpxP family protein refolding chaperone
MKTVSTLLVLLGLTSAAAAQVAGGRPGRAGAPPVVEGGVSPAEVQRMFDAYALMQAQEQLHISDDQFSAFLSRFKALQEVRRRTLQERARVTMELRRLLNQGQPDDAQMRERLKALQDIAARGAEEERKAYEAIDQILDIRQQARFRVFEEVMERRKLELVARARQANRPKNNQR